MELINLAKAKVCGVLPGASADLDEKNPSVAAALSAGLLVEAQKHRAALLEAAGGDGALSAALAEIELLRARVAELEAALAKPAAPKAPRGAKVEG